MNASPPEATEDELTFWRRVFYDYRTNPGANTNFTEKLDPAMPLQGDILARIRRRGLPAGSTVRILDVGCGPISTIGKVSPDHKIELTGLDPLADDYRALMNESNFKLPHKMVAGVGEDANRLFPAESFDYIHVENALDHCYDPMAVLSGLQKIANREAVIFVRVFVKEGEHNEYSGFHAWNFDLYDKKVVFWKPGQIHFLEEAVSLPVRSWMDETSVGHNNEKRSILLFEILNADMRLSSQNVRKMGPMRVRYIPDFNALVLDKDEPIDEEKKFFIHGTYAQVGPDQHSGPLTLSFRWDKGRSRRIVYLPKGALKHMTLGQFTVQYGKLGDRTFHNTWSNAIQI